MSSLLTPYEALCLAIERAGSQSEIARNLGVAQPTVWKWLHKARQMPAEYVLTTERLYGVSRHLLRPDIYPVDLLPAADSKTVAAAGEQGSCDHRAKLQPASTTAFALENRA